MRVCRSIEIRRRKASYFHLQNFNKRLTKRQPSIKILETNGNYNIVIKNREAHHEGIDFELRNGRRS